ncbi:1838_t:CDS:1, partial [Acaulospora colombiana]
MRKNRAHELYLVSNSEVCADRAAYVLDGRVMGSNGARRTGMARLRLRVWPMSMA